MFCVFGLGKGEKKPLRCFLLSDLSTCESRRGKKPFFFLICPRVKVGGLMSQWRFPQTLWKVGCRLREQLSAGRSFSGGPLCTGCCSVLLCACVVVVQLEP